jgi:hypothetical protein
LVSRLESLSKQQENLEESLNKADAEMKRLKTENTCLWVGVGVTITVAVVTTIWALVERSRR